MRPETLLDVLLGTPAVDLDRLPFEQGIYALYDHTGTARYIGVTEMGLRKRIFRYHVGGDGNSHKFSTVFNAGRMFHERNDPFTDQSDGRIAKELRRLFSRSRCRAVGQALPGLSKAELFGLEGEVRRLAPASALSWNDVRALDAYEPRQALDAFLGDIRWSSSKLDAIARQALRWEKKQVALAGGAK